MAAALSLWLVEIMSPNVFRESWIFSCVSCLSRLISLAMADCLLTSIMESAATAARAASAIYNKVCSVILFAP